MASIQPFRAIRPSSAHIDPVYLQDILEPGLVQDQGQVTMDDCLDRLRKLLTSGAYNLEKCPAIYLYETTVGTESQTGLWALTDLKDSEEGRIITHEHTLPENEEQIRCYREYVGLEGAPILLTYYPQQEISELIELVKTTHIPECFYHLEQYHRIWQVTLDTLISQFQDAFLKLKSVYVADGHHRLAAAAAMHKNERQFISTLYIPTAELKISAFHRLVVPEAGTLPDLLTATISKYYYISAIPNNRPYFPDQMNRIGLYVQGFWYQLDLKREEGSLSVIPDVMVLQEKILEPVFGIADPRTDPRLYSFPALEGSEELLQRIQQDPVAVAFTLFPMTIRQLIEQAESQVALPPKSTWIEPKVPFGLLMYCTAMDDPCTQTQDLREKINTGNTWE